MTNSLRSRIIISCLLMGTLPALAIGIVAWSATGNLEQATINDYQSQARHVADKIDRNLFERYGDVQAFGLNGVITDRESWYDPDADNPIVKAMNRYVDTYDIYYLTVLVDLDGKVIATNTKNQDGQPIDTAFLYEQNYANTSWFKSCLAEDFYESDDGSFTGTFVEHLYKDEDARRVYNDEGLALGYSAPVYDDAGEIIAIWKNVTKFGLVEEIIYSACGELNNRGLESVEITLLDDEGNVIVDCDPLSHGTNNVVRDMSVIGKLNLVDLDMDAAKRVVNGESGSLLAVQHARKGITQCAGFAPHEGALGFPGMKWNVLVRVNSDEALASVNGLKRSVMAFMSLAALLIAAATFWLARVLMNPINTAIDAIEEISNGDFTTRMPDKGSDEIVRLSTGFNKFADQMQNVIDNATTESTAVAATATEVADSMNAMASSTTDVSSNMQNMANSIDQMTTSISEVSVSAGKSAQVAEQAASLAEASNVKIGELGTAADEIGRVIQVIEEIAEQTNLLALNATIEAARAGEAGKGFAVVATEVKELARQTAAATDDIRSRIQGIQASTGGAVDSIQQISDVINDVNDVAQTIASAVEEQSITTQEIAKRITRTAEAAETVAKGVSESATSGNEIRHSITRIDQLLRLQRNLDVEPTLAS